MINSTKETQEPRVRQSRLIRVGVFPPDDSCRSYQAYTRYYLTSWPGCCEHEVEAINGTEAKKLAIKEHKDQCAATSLKQDAMLTQRNPPPED